jgi:hypothetical protein
MLSELREDVQIANGRKKGRKLTFRLRNLSVARLSYGRDNDTRLHTCCLGVSCKSGLENIGQLSKEKRLSYVKENRNFMKHEAFGCLTRGAEVVAFATIDRDEDALVAEPPIIMLRIAGDEAFKKTLSYLKLYSDVDFVLVGTPMFAYEHVLKCLQETVDLPLTEELFLQQKEESVRESDIVPLNVINAIKEHGNGDIQSILGTSNSVRLDASQLESLLAGLTQRVSLIQGPPGMWIGSRLVLPRLNNAVAYRHWEIIHRRPPDQSPPRPYEREDTCHVLYQSCSRSVFGRPFGHWYQSFRHC